jgi:hypothetical protein
VLIWRPSHSFAAVCIIFPQVTGVFGGGIEFLFGDLRRGDMFFQPAGT